MLVATTQFSPIFKNPKANLQTVFELVVRAAEAGAEIICLPELCTTGYSFMNRVEAEPFAEILQLRESRSMAVMETLVKKYDIAIALGIMERDPNTDKLYNSQVFMMPDSRFVVCRKISPWGNDRLWSTPGTASPPIVEYLGKKVGLLICRDIRNESDNMSHLYEAGDADIVLFSANFGKGEFPSGRWVDFAKNTKSWLITSNRFGIEVHNDFGLGGICIISPTGEVNCEGLKWGEPCMVLGEVP